ncbi:dTDP-4-amino-4,6-dideoxygalactose transaminase [Marinobacterium sp. D7]|uniref:dTDP-4-amino-4,6-dideoxygalactose transaminase n=1 Tax=Marinobacterium ramblicola TaxID=2849041 RepID=UPI001C2D1F29|nr:dTDP-4-amino-4,6-dideoxygalactose transaminase [Marinobacterium ramblicola]MBV1789419.1 dTDP-4-amino-4,6-dideoxygalactose transaminase [Marinobacterium ramblicola]
MTVEFNSPTVTGNEERYVIQAINSQKKSGDGPFGKKCQAWFEKMLPANKVLITPSCTSALEMAALLINIKPGDEVIMPSYTFVSTANAFVLRGAKVVFVDIRPDTMNIDENVIEAAITKKTRAIVPVHYAGVSCEMDIIMEIASRHNLYVIEDAAQGMMSSYNGKALGTIGHFGAFSFHETKNYTSGGEGGLLIINDEGFKERADIIREKGTNRSLFFRGMVDKYQWVDIGSSYLPSELQAAYLWGQLEFAEEINENRLSIWKRYYKGLLSLQDTRKLSLPIIPSGCCHNAHMFYIKVANLEERSSLIAYLKDNDIMAAFHYVPLHTSSAGLKYAEFIGKDRYTTIESERLLRLPMWYGLNEVKQQYVIDMIKEFYQ